MKLTYNPTPQHLFILEGSPDEIMNFVTLVTRTAGIKNLEIPTQVIESRNDQKNTDLTTDDFLKSIYLYEPNPANDSGRGAFIVQQILKGETLNIDKLARRSQGSRQTVFNAVRRMQEHGAKVEITRTTVKLISIPNPPYTARVYRGGYKIRRNVAPTRVISSAKPKISTGSEQMLKNLSAIKIS